MKLTEFWPELLRRNRLLAYTGLLFLGLALVLLLLMPFDTRTILGINPWIKPLKFNLSATIYLWTLGWLLHYLPDTRSRLVRRVSWVVALCMLLEIVLITGQSVRGVASHFNAATPLDGVIFDIMGMAIFINTLAIVYVLVVFMRDSPPIGRAYLAGIRLGLLVFLLGSLVGVAMVMNNGHSVGVADGGPGLPFLNWSTQGGDLRAAHFIGMHALQLFPLIGYLLHRYQIRMGLISPARLTVVCCLVYTALTFFLFSAAMQGKPLVAQHPEGVPAGEITHTQR